jgi:hypothetical protein
MAQVVEQLLTKHKFRHQYCQKKKRKKKKECVGLNMVCASVGHRNGVVRTGVRDNWNLKNGEAKDGGEQRGLCWEGGDGVGGSQTAVICIPWVPFHSVNG